MDICKSLNDIYLTLNQLEVRATPANVRLLTAVYIEIENMINNEVDNKGSDEECQTS